MGKGITWLTQRLNHGRARRVKGGLALIAAIASSAVIGHIIQNLPFGQFFELLMVAFLLAHRSLVDHVLDVASALTTSVTEGRRSVSRIVGRDTSSLDRPQVARAAIESAAENFSDGVVAPAFWYLILGLPGILIYKAVNTADSMIGYRTPEFEEFGWASARLDDVLNFVPARLTAFIIALVSGQLGMWKDIATDARLHRSPNAGWPEAALARAVGVALAGPRSYSGALQEFSFVNPLGRMDAGPSDIRKSVGWLWPSWAVALTLALAMSVFA